MKYNSMQPDTFYILYSPEREKLGVRKNQSFVSRKRKNKAWLRI